MNVFLRELQAYRRSTFTWVVSLSVLVVVFMGLYPAFMNDVEATKQLLSGLPPAIRAAFNIQLETFFTVYGFFAYLLGFVTVAGAVQAMNLGTGVIAKENAGKTADFLLSKPVTRSRVISAKLAAAFTAVVITSAVFSLVAYFTAVSIAEEDVSAGTFLLMASTFFLVQVFFLALGALMAVVLPKVKSVIAVTLPTVFGFYIVGTLGDVLGNEQVRYLSPFKFYDTLYIAAETSLEGKYLLFETFLVVLAVGLTYVVYRRKDVRAPA